MKVKCKFKFLQEVSQIADPAETVMIVTDLQLRADGTFVYGCLKSSGEVGWHREFELRKVKNDSKKLGFEVIIK